MARPHYESRYIVDGKGFARLIVWRVRPLILDPDIKIFDIILHCYSFCMFILVSHLTELAIRMSRCSIQ
jgi:hypothetical protein